MKVRKKGREIAFRMLFAIEAGGNKIADAMIPFKHESPVVLDFALHLVKGTLSQVKKIDREIENIIINWKIERLYLVDKQLLRLGIYEMDYEEDVEDGIVVFEAVELAKKYGDIDSPNFVNGILREHLRRREHEVQKA